jgi:aminoglycoside phosphotransferase (APT) family kinase protein
MSGARLTPVREAHRFDEAALQTYLERHQVGFRGPLSIRQFEGGQSNPTYLLEARSGSYVLRKQPPGELLPSAHQVDREYCVMDALAHSLVPVPRMRCLCVDREVIGAAFYVMDYVEGRMFSDATLPGLTPVERDAVYRDLARVLAQLHRVDPQAVGLGEFGRPGNYFARQISRWSRQYDASATENIEAMTRLMQWLPENIPASERVSIVHGDFRIGNCLMEPAEPRIAAVLDWELSTLGDPLADLGYVCQIYYIKANDIGLAGADLAELGIPDQQAFVAEYCRHMGIERLDHLPFSIIYNLFRLAGISQGVYKRGLDGNASSETALTFKDLARMYAEIAWNLVVTLDGSPAVQRCGHSESLRRGAP